MKCPKWYLEQFELSSIDGDALCFDPFLYPEKHLVIFL